MLELNQLQQNAIAIATKMVESGLDPQYIGKGYEHKGEVTSYVTFSYLQSQYIEYYDMMAFTKQPDHRALVIQDEPEKLSFQKGTADTLAALKSEWTCWPVFYDLFKDAITISDADFIPDESLLAKCGRSAYLTEVGAIAYDMSKLCEILTEEYGVAINAEYLTQPNPVVYTTGL